MLPYLLNLIYCIALIISFPILLYRIFIKGKDRNLISRLGFLSASQVDIWIHGVSVGEIKATAPLVKELEKQYPEHKILISSTSSNGLKVAKQMYDKHTILSFPLDFSWAVKSYLKKLNPKLIVLMELEIWPNFLLAAYKKNIPVILVNGRFSQKSTERYLYIKKLFSKITKGVKVFSVQNELYASRLTSLGIEKTRIAITGNIKFDAISLQLPDQKTTGELKKKFGIKDIDQVIVVGSSHEPEERELVSAYHNLCKKFEHLRLIIVPRHPERKHKVAQYISNIDLVPHFTSSLGNGLHFSSKDVIIGDTMGELVKLYSLATIVFVGGSLIPHGGQNFIEPAIQQKAVVCGRYMQNFPDIKLFIEKEFIIQVKSSEELLLAFSDLCSNREKAQLMGKQAASLIKSLQGSIAKNLNICNKYLE